MVEKEFWKGGKPGRRRATKALTGRVQPRSIEKSLD
jgi:hypothetical protein